MMNLLNTKSKLSYLLFLGKVCCACILGSCKDDDVIDPDAPSVPKPGTAVENIILMSRHYVSLLRPNNRTWL